MSDPRIEYTGRIRHVQVGTYLPLQVTLDELEAQHAKGWVDYHPENFCHRCGNQNVTWWTSRETWDPVMRPPGEPWKWHEIVCIPCFIELAEMVYSRCSWRITRDDNGSEVLALDGAASTEWGVRPEPGARVFRCRNEADARDVAKPDEDYPEGWPLVSRQVTEWRAAE